MKYYAVHKGHKKGVFDNWGECQASINGYSGAVFKKCNTQSEANYFCEYGKLPIKKYEKLDTFFGGSNLNKRMSSSTNTILFEEKKKYQKLDKFCTEVVDTDDEEQDIIEKEDIIENKEDTPLITQPSNNKEPIYVYTDGSCIHNGKPNAKAGIGVYFSENDPRNVSRTFKGKQSNNTAELNAIIDVSEILKDEIERKEPIVICTDSKYGMRSCTTYGAKLASNGWTEKKPNLELVKKAYNIYRNKYNVTFKHIMAHTGKQDRHSIGNDGADRLANMAIGLHQCPYSSNKSSTSSEKRSKRIYLKVPFDHKDDAKKLGAKWDFRKKKWYIDEESKHKDILVMRYPL
tara:strand:- start:2136 stop:3173 length:1038 start_codon:yes stop_codon:yes gene_type:complete